MQEKKFQTKTQNWGILSYISWQTMLEAILGNVNPIKDEKKIQWPDYIKIVCFNAGGAELGVPCDSRHETMTSRQASTPWALYQKIVSSETSLLLCVLCMHLLSNSCCMSECGCLCHVSRGHIRVTPDCMLCDWPCACVFVCMLRHKEAPNILQLQKKLEVLPVQILSIESFLFVAWPGIPLQKPCVLWVHCWLCVVLVVVPWNLENFIYSSLIAAYSVQYTCIFSLKSGLLNYFPSIP